MESRPNSLARSVTGALLKSIEVLSSLDLVSDYHDLAVATQGLGFLESGITQPLNHVSNSLLEFSSNLRHLVSKQYQDQTRA